jgi:hypothetical protein
MQLPTDGDAAQADTGWNRSRTLLRAGAAGGAAMVGLAGRTGAVRVATAGEGAGNRAAGAATAGCTRWGRLTGTTRDARGALRVGPRSRADRSSSTDGGAGGATGAEAIARLGGREEVEGKDRTGVLGQAVGARDATVRLEAGITRVSRTGAQATTRWGVRTVVVQAGAYRVEAGVTVRDTTRVVGQTGVRDWVVGP